MALNEQQKERVKRWLADCHIEKCPACGAIYKFAVRDDLLSMQVAVYDGGAHPSPTPMVQVACTDCAHVMLFYAASIGVVYP